MGAAQHSSPQASGSSLAEALTSYSSCQPTTASGGNDSA
jgi:hypothetical protein